MPAQNLTLGLNEALFELVFGAYVQANASLFAGSVTILDTAVSYAAASRPTVLLYATRDTGGGASNASITFDPVRVSLQGDAPVDLSLTTTGLVTLQGGTLSITALSTTIAGAGGWLDRAIAKQVDTRIAQQFEQALAHITIPVFGEIFNSSLTVAIDDAAIANGICAVHGSLTYRGEGSAGPAPSVVGDTSSTPSLGIATNASGLQVVLFTQRSRFPLVAPVKEIAEKPAGPLGDFGAGIKGTIGLSYPRLSVSGSSAAAVSDVSFALQGGVEAFGSWTWVSLPIPDVTAELFVALGPDASGRIAELRLTGIGDVDVHVEWPSVLKPAGDSLASLLDAVIGDFRGAIGAALRSLSFPIFTLPPAVPGIVRPVPVTFAQLAFAQSGLASILHCG
jgi:hypothetical protein